MAGPIERLPWSGALGSSVSGVAERSRIHAASDMHRAKLDSSVSAGRPRGPLFRRPWLTIRPGRSSGQARIEAARAAPDT
eukprot:3568409-Pyramimonas_sp.AAC.1